MKTHAFLTFLAAVLTGCAAAPQLADETPASAPALSRYAVIYALVDASPDVKTKPDYTTVSGRLLRSFVDDLTAAGKAVTTTPTGAERTLEARLTITDFNSVSTAARLLAGALAGSAKLDVTLTLKDASTGATVGLVSSTDSSSFLHGVFAADSDRQIEATAKELATKLADVGSAAGTRFSSAGLPSPAASGVKASLEDLRLLPQGSPKQVLAIATADPEASGAAALTPAQFFEKASPSVLGVRALDAQDRPLAAGSAVVIDPTHAVTACHLLVKASAVEVRRESTTQRAKLEHADVERDLCVLGVADPLASSGTRLSVAGVKVGQRAYSITFDERLGLGLGDGLVTGVQSQDPSLPPVRVAMQLASEASGAGVFDERGRLIGIVTMNAPRAGMAPNVNFVLPSRWIVEAPERAKQQLAKASPWLQAKSTSVAPTGPTGGQGAVWTYTFRDRVFSNRDRDFSVRATAADGSSVTEILSSGGEQQTFAASTQDVGFYTRKLAGEELIELSPYLLVRVPTPSMPLPAVPRLYPGAGDPKDWSVQVTRVRQEEVSVPAGRYQAYRITMTGANPGMSFYYTNGASSAANDRPVRFEYEAWYAPEVGRYVQLHHQTWGRSGRHLSDEWVQLKTFSPAGAAPADKKGG